MSIRETIQKYSEVFSSITYKESSRSERQEVMDEYMSELRSKRHDEAIIEINDGLKKLSLNPSPTVDDWILAAQLYPSIDYVPSLIQLLDQQIETIWNEGIIHVLSRIPDERAVPALSRAIDFVTTSDESRELAKLAMEVLAIINTPEAQAIVEQYVNDESEYVSEFAQEMYDYMTKNLAKDD